MAGICCGVGCESEPAVSVEQSSRASRRRRLELRPFNLVADVAVLPPSENDRKRKKLELYTALTAAHARENTEQNCEAKDSERGRTVNKEELVGNNEAADDLVNDNPKFGMTSVCGRRRDMEDTVSIHPSFCKQNRTHFYGVFDGHGCSHVSTWRLIN